MTVVDETMGALLIGVILSGIFYGISCSQIYYYFTRYQNDSRSLKMLVFSVWASDSIHQALISHSIYWYLITEYGNPVAMSMLNKTIVAEVLFNAFTGLFVQSFFVVRVWKLSEKKLYLVVPVAILVAAEFGVSATYTARAFWLRTFNDLAELRGLSICMNVFAAAADVAIAAILCTILHTSRTNFSKSNTLINKLIVFAVNTGLLTSVCACISLITFFAMPGAFIYILFYFLIGRLYSNSLMATLNARKSLREGSANDVSLSLRDMQPATTMLNGPGRRGEGIAIRIDTTKESRHDGDADQDHDQYKFDSQDKHPVEEV
ncbi:hypothetical protein L226DRAFT_74988 [Lentinus tigrinus ALCF2SS1-7]|uniref:uncharacterized protein n=1 Tax=Lentinus tigrinus ALCF2SS1-7 TaxID=1328758 RepID=UPI00116606A2|nr:hypothetical protein L226DRAFT_74988 [Lentinus tigrinus ALCF2SS1-7]